jgi:anaerobic magnesium-protoporphyrin IX monomethyl ester cyclase
MGGVHPTFMWKEVLEDCQAVDFIVRYEGEVALPQLLITLSKNGDLNRVRGIAYRQDERPVATSLAPYIEKLDSLTKAWDLLDWEDYIYFASDNKRLAILDTSRGCPFGCTFCSQQRYWEKSWRARSPEKVIKEIEHLHSQFDVEVFMFSDELPTWSRERWERLLDLLIERDLGIEILMESRGDDILRDEDIMEKYKKAGVSHIYVGLESVSQKTLDFFKKDIKVAQSKKVVDLINEYDIISETSFVLGMPDDTHGSIQKTLDLAKHYNADMTFFLAISPWPYSEIYPELEPYIVNKDYSNYNLITPVIKPKAMSIEEVQNELDRCHMEFYMSKMKQLGSLSAFKRKYMRDVFKILKDSCIGDLIKKISLPEAMRTALRA